MVMWFRGILRISGIPMYRRELPHVMRAHARSFATTKSLWSTSEHRVILDNQTLYIDKSLAESLGWKPEQGSDAGLQLSLTGWGPSFFTITPTGTDSDRLARSVVESSRNPNVKKVLDYLKER